MKATIAEQPRRNVVKKDKQKGIYNNGIDNCYPQRVERIINDSVTAKSGTAMLASFLTGSGFVDDNLNGVVVSTDLFGETTLFELHQKVCQSLSKHNAAAVQLQYNAVPEVISARYVPYRYCRFGLTDSNEYSGFIHVYRDWEKSQGGIRQDKILKIHSFNTKPEVIRAQFEADGKDYRGQIAVLRLDDEFIYPLSTVDPALEDCDTEALIKKFKNGELSSGFFMKYILYHTNFDNEQEQREFKELMQRFMGGDSTGRVLMAEGSFDENGSLEKANNFQLQKIEQNINDKLFESYEKSVANNIRKALMNIPSILIEQQEGGFFGSSGEAYIQAFNLYNAMTASSRATISAWYAKLFARSNNPLLANGNFTIKNLTYGTVDVS